MQDQQEKETRSKRQQPTGHDAEDIAVQIDSTELVQVTENGLKLFPQPVADDALDPLNWSSAQKHTILAIIMALYFMFTYITTVTVPSFPALQDQYSATLEQVNWTVAIPALGLSLGPLIFATPADTIGRRPIILLGTVVALASTVGAALAPSLPTYMAARFFQGLGVSPAANVGLAVIGDLFHEHERGSKVGLWVLAIDSGLLCGPLVGGFTGLAGHAWTQWSCAILFATILVAELAFLPETLYPRDLMAASSSTLNGSSGPGREKNAAAAPASPPPLVRRTKELPFVNVAPVPGIHHPNPLDTIVRFVKTFRYTVVPIAIVTYCFAWYWWVLSVVTLVPVAYPDYAPNIQGLLFIGLIVGTLVSEVLFSGRLSDRLVIHFTKRGAVKTPEMRLWLIYPAVVLTAVGLVVWGVSIDEQYHWMVGQVAFALFGAGIQMGNTAVCAYAVDAYPLQSMAVMTFYAVMLNMSAFVDPFFIVPWIEAAGFTWAMAGHALITAGVCLPVFALLHRFGARLRSVAGEPDWTNPEFGGGGGLELGRPRGGGF
ncbi:hypothetical protein PpBr36_07806 [Pyricularia pennisetigena]|uniref:hypothetical protein n=1 Tax=Pyricularia pennisetigena TaxID=1578925 RepID=UPI001154AE92|nr:hypothetical protein PpBr36_07806 [Pyricularia pennisetigena]TLS25637.1 hypothetical protein PpBr36_07806 [Pyricularia pennisetigena]